MDELDRKLLYEISERADEPRNKIAKKLRCSREVVDYRLKKLQKEGIITGFQARVNISNFVYGGYIFFIQSFGLNSESEKKVINKLKANKKIQYMGKLGGEYDFIIGFTIKKLSELSETIDEINSAFGKNKSNQTLLTMVREIKDSFKTIFSKNNEHNNIVSMPNINEKIKIDEVDKKILIPLGKNSNIPSWEIAEKVKISDVAVRKRIENLTKKRIILNFRTMIDLTKLNYQPYFLFIKINPIDKKLEDKFIEFSKINKNITYSMKIAGRYDYILTISVENSKQLKEFIYDLKNKFSDIITEISISPLFEMIYHTQLAEDFLE